MDEIAAPAVYLDTDGTPVYRASKLGLCLRALTAARLGMPGVPPSEKQERDMAAGQAYESVIYHKLERMGEVTDRQRRYELVLKDAVVRIHIDGIGHHIRRQGVTSHVLELKALAPSTVRSWRSRRFVNFPTWAWQLSVGMHATGLPGLMVIADRVTGGILLDEVDEPPHDLAAIEERVDEVEHYARTGWLAECNGAFFCSWFFLHDSGYAGEGAVLRPEATPPHVRGILRLAHAKALGALRERVELRLAEVGE